MKSLNLKLKEDKKGDDLAREIAKCLVDVKGYSNINQVSGRDFQKALNNVIIGEDNFKYMGLKMENHPLRDKIARYLTEINHNEISKCLARIKKLTKW